MLGKLGRLVICEAIPSYAVCVLAEWKGVLTHDKEYLILRGHGDLKVQIYSLKIVIFH